MRKLLALTMLLAVLTGCAKQAPPAAPPAGPPATTAPAPPTARTDPAAVYEAAPQAPAVATPIESNLPKAAPLPEGLRRAELPPGEPLSQAGFYFMDVATGKLEGWLPPVDQYGWPRLALGASPDGRWVTVQQEQSAYLIRRSDGAAFQYDPRQVAVLHGPGVLLVRPNVWRTGDGGRCALLDEQMRLVSTFSLQQDACQVQGELLFSPDGKVLAMPNPHGDGSFFLVTVSTGAVKKTEPFAVPADLRRERVSFAALPATGELVAEFMLMPASGTSYQPTTHIRRYSWQGDLKAETRVAGSGPALSRDGKLLVYTEYMGQLGSAAVIREWGAQQPLFRVAGGWVPRWVAGSTDLLVATSRGYRLVTADGRLQPAPLAAPAPDMVFNPFLWLTSSPDNPDRFLTRSAVVDRAGRIIREIPLKSEQLRVGQSTWGPTAASVQFLVTPTAGKGWDAGLSEYLAPKVQRPPYPDKFPLQVEDPKGECLNLRAEEGPSGRLIRCLPTGTKLALADPAPDRWPFGQLHGWIQVVTEKGEKGWVAVYTFSVTYAD